MAMQIIELHAKEYRQFIKPAFFFDSVEFNELNRGKADELKYLVFKDSKYRLGIAFGIKEGIAMCPFSAPFSAPSHIKDEVSVMQIDETIQELDRYLSERCDGARFVLPPMFYASDDISCLLSALRRVGFTIETVDLNYQVDLERFEQENYVSILHYNAKKNFIQSVESGLTLEQCESERHKKIAYDVIAENRASKGYPLRMTWGQLNETLKVVKHDVFTVRKGDTEIAAAIIYRISPRVSQIIYWGDVPGYSEYRPMNFLSYNVVMHCKRQGRSYLDIGPSTENGVPNYGLCDFKQSIGCGVSAKFTVTKEYGSF